MDGLCKWEEIDAVPESPEPPEPPPKSDLEELAEAGKTRQKIKVMADSLRESEETRALVTADECLRVIEQCNDALRHEYELHAVGAKRKMPDKCAAELYEAIKTAARNLKLQMIYVYAQVKDADA